MSRFGHGRGPQLLDQWPTERKRRCLDELAITSSLLASGSRYARPRCLLRRICNPGCMVARASWANLDKGERMFLVSRLNVRIANKWWVTIAVTLGMLMSIMDSTIVNVAIPTMR